MWLLIFSVSVFAFISCGGVDEDDVVGFNLPLVNQYGDTVLNGTIVGPNHVLLPTDQIISQIVSCHNYQNYKKVSGKRKKYSIVNF